MPAVLSTPSKAAGAAASSSSPGCRIPLTGLSESEKKEVADEQFMLDAMVAGMVQQRKLISSMYVEYQKRLQSEAARNAGSNSGGSKFSTAIKTLRSIDGDWLINFVTSTSGLTATTVVKMWKHEPELPWRLMTFETGLPIALKCSEFAEAQIMEVMFTLFGGQAKEYGYRIAKVAKKGAAKSASWDWVQFGVYTLEIKSYILKSVKHISGDKVEVTEPFSVKDHSLEYNWGDWTAEIKKGKWPGTKVCMFFDNTGKGPYRKTQISNKGDDWKKMVVAAHADWLKTVEGVAPAVMGLDAEAAKEKDAIVADKKAKAVEQAKVTAAKTAQERAAKKQKLEENHGDAGAPTA